MQEVKDGKKRKNLTFHAIFAEISERIYATHNSIAATYFASFGLAIIHVYLIWRVKLTIFFRSHSIDNLHIQISILLRHHFHFDSIPYLLFHTINSAMLRYFMIRSGLVRRLLLSLTILSCLISHVILLYPFEYDAHKCTRAQ